MSTEYPTTEVSLPHLERTLAFKQRALRTLAEMLTANTPLDVASTLEAAVTRTTAAIRDAELELIRSERFKDGDAKTQGMARAQVRLGTARNDKAILSALAYFLKTFNLEWDDVFGTAQHVAEDDITNLEGAINRRKQAE